MQTLAERITPPLAMGCQSTTGWLGRLELSGLLIWQSVILPTNGGHLTMRFHRLER